MSNIPLDKLFINEYTTVMLNANIVNIRDILRNHKQILEQVKSTKKRITVVTQDIPQVGIVSLDDLKKLEELDKQAKYQASTKSLLDVAQKVQGVLKHEHLPKDLSAKHDYYHYTEDTKE